MFQFSTVIVLQYFSVCFQVHVVSTTSNPLGDDPIVRRERGGNFREFSCPPPVAAYQNFMGGVDKCMQHRAKNPVGRPSKKYWKFFFNFILELAMTDAFKLWRRTPGTKAQKTRYQLLDFRVDVAQQLIAGFKGRKRRLPLNDVAVVHSLDRLQRKRSYCKWCTKEGDKRRKDTVYGCKFCNIHLCSPGCFTRYHEEQDALVN